MKCVCPNREVDERDVFERLLRGEKEKDPPHEVDALQHHLDHRRERSPAHESQRTAVLQTTIQQMQALVEEKDRLLDQKKVLAEELQHRVRNNLQLVYGMLSKQLEDTEDRAGQRGIRAIAMS